MRIGFVNTPFPVRPLAAEERHFSRAFFYALFTTSFSSIPEEEWRWLPQVERCNLGLLSLSATLQRRGHECRYFTIVASSEDDEETLTQRILEDLEEVLCELDLLCVYSITVNAHIAETIARRAKRRNPQVSVGFGGPHASALGVSLIRDGCFDFVAFGEGEDSLVEFVTERSCGRRYPEVEGILCRNCTSILGSPRRRRNKQPDFLPPAYQLAGISRLPAARIFPNRGCPNSCAFCADPWRGKTTYVPLERILEEIELLVARYGTRYLYLGCEDFLCDFERAKGIAQVIHSHFPEVRWTAQCRVQSALPVEFLEELARCGCSTIEFGVESADQSILNLVNKNISIENAQACFSKAKQAGLVTHAYWMVGLPGESHRTALLTQRTMLEWAEQDLVDTWEYKMFIPYPGTPVFSSPSRYGITILSQDFSTYHHNGRPVCRTHELTPDEIYDYYLEGSQKSAELLAQKHRLRGEFEVNANLSSLENMF